MILLFTKIDFQSNGKEWSLLSSNILIKAQLSVRSTLYQVQRIVGFIYGV